MVSMFRSHQPGSCASIVSMCFTRALHLQLGVAVMPMRERSFFSSVPGPWAAGAGEGSGLHRTHIGLSRESSDLQRWQRSTPPSPIENAVDV